MILGFIAIIFFTAAIGLIATLGASVTFSAAIPIAFHQLGFYMGLTNFFLPVSELMTVLTLTMAIVVPTFSVRVVLYLIALLRGNSMPGGA